MLPATPLSSLVLKPADVALKLSDIELEHRREAEVCGRTEAQLACLQAWAAALSPPEPVKHHWWQR